MDRTVWTESNSFSGPTGFPITQARSRAGYFDGPPAVQAPQDLRFKAYDRQRRTETPDEAQFRGLNDLMSTRPGVERPEQR